MKNEYRSVTPSDIARDVVRADSQLEHWYAPTSREILLVLTLCAVSGTVILAAVIWVITWASR